MVNQICVKNVSKNKCAKKVCVETDVPRKIEISYNLLDLVDFILRFYYLIMRKSLNVSYSAQRPPEG